VNTLRDYKLELRWLLLVILLFLASPSHPSAQDAQNLPDEAPGWCDDVPGWCPLL
jgi:hypothetical protein